MDELEFKAKITDVKWPTNTKGEITPILVLDKEYVAKKDKDEQHFDGIAFLNFNDIKAKECGIGSEVIIKCNDRLEPQIAEVTVKSDKFKFPKKCMYCKNEVYSMNERLFCINHLCIAQGRTPIFKLITLANMVQLQRDHVVDIHTYLSKLPYKGDTTNVEHIYVYLKILQAEFSRIATQARKDELQASLGDKKGAGIWMYEFSIKQKLKAGIKANEFWYLAGLPFSDRDYKRICDYDFIEHGQNEKLLKKLKLTDHGYRVLEDNAQLTKMLRTELSAF